MDEVNIILLCSGGIIALIAGASWYVSTRVSHITCCSMRGYTPVSEFDDI